MIKARLDICAHSGLHPETSLRQPPISYRLPTPSEKLHRRGTKIVIHVPKLAMDGCPWAAFEGQKSAMQYQQKTVNEEGGTIAFLFRRFLLPLQQLQSLKVEIVNINDFAHVVKIALQLYDFEDFAIVTDCSFYRVFKVSPR